MAKNSFNLIVSVIALSGFSLLLYLIRPWKFEIFNTKRITPPKVDEADDIEFEKPSEKEQGDQMVEGVIDNEEQGEVEEEELAFEERFEEIEEKYEEKIEEIEIKKSENMQTNSAVEDEAQKLAEQQKSFALKRKMFEEKQSEGTNLFKKGEYEEAISLFDSAMQILEELTSLTPQQQSNYEISLLNNRAAAYEKLKQYDTALQDCLFVLSNDPYHVRTRGRKARIHQEQKELKLALKELCIIQRIHQMKQEPFDPPAMFVTVIDELATQLLQEFENQKEKPAHGSYTKRKSLMSFSIMEKLINQVHNWEIFEIDTKLEEENDLRTRAHLLFQRALIYIHQNQFDKVKPELETAADYLRQLEVESKDSNDNNQSVESKAEEALFWSMLGIFRSFENEFQSASDAFEYSVKLDPSNLDLWVIYATSSLESNVEKAKELFEKANTFSPKSADFYYHRAQVAIVSRDLDSAKKDAELAVACDPDNSALKALHYQLLIETMDTNIDTVFQEIMQDVTHPDLLALKAQICLGAGQIDQVLKCADQIHSLEQDNPLSFIFKAQILFQEEKLDDAAMLFEQAFRLEPATDVLVHLGQIKLLQIQNLEEADQALEFFRKAICLSVSPLERREAAKLFLLTEGQIEAAKALGLTKLVQS